MKLEAHKPSGTAAAVIGFLIVSMAVNITMALHLRHVMADDPPAKTSVARAR
ncbi:MAG: hypothetical protein U0Q16_04395 [Bryobacteraceae bacterium]